MGMIDPGMLGIERIEEAKLSKLKLTPNCYLLEVVVM
jgi:hypothetical protein